MTRTGVEPVALNPREAGALSVPGSGFAVRVAFPGESHPHHSPPFREGIAHLALRAWTLRDSNPPLLAFASPVPSRDCFARFGERVRRLAS